MNNWLAGVIIGLLLFLWISLWYAQQQLFKLRRATRRLVRHSRPGGGYDMAVVAMDHIREVQFLVGDKVSEGEW